MPKNKKSKKNKKQTEISTHTFTNLIELKKVHLNLMNEQKVNQNNPRVRK